MRNNIRRNKKALMITIVLSAVLLTTTVLAVTTIQNQAQSQNQNAYPLINLYLQGVFQNPNDIIILPKYVISDNY